MLFGDRITNAPHVPRLRALREARALVNNPVAMFETYRRECSGNSAENPSIV